MWIWVVNCYETGWQILIGMEGADIHVLSWVERRLVRDQSLSYLWELFATHLRCLFCFSRHLSCQEITFNLRLCLLGLVLVDVCSRCGSLHCLLGVVGNVRRWHIIDASVFLRGLAHQRRVIITYLICPVDKTGVWLYFLVSCVSLALILEASISWGLRVRQTRMWAEVLILVVLVSCHWELNFNNTSVGE